MRARNLKPAIFKNEFLAVSDPLYTIIFEGLWCLADREGRLEDRPAKIHMEINPGRAFEGTEKSLAWLAENGFIHRYSIGKARYIQVIKFYLHQNPHQKEASSTIPKPGASLVQAPDEPESGPGEQVMDEAPARLIPSSLTPDSGFLTPGSTNPVFDSRDDDWFLAFKLAFPERSGDPNWHGAKRAAKARIAEGHDPGEFIGGAERYGEFCRITGKLATEFVMQAARFLGPSKPFLQPWTPPPTKADVRLKSSLSAAEEFLRRTEPTDAPN